MANESSFDSLQGAPTSLAIGDTGAPKSVQSAVTQAQSQITQFSNGAQPFTGFTPTPDIHANATRARNLEVLTQIAGDVLKPHIEAQKQEMFDNGVVQAMQGKAINDIVDEQPGYSKIFGASSSVDGARAMTALTVTTNAATQTVKDMPELRKQSPAQFQQYLLDQKKSLLTGDAITDAMVSRKSMETWQTTIGQHTKENYKYIQEETKKSYISLNEASGGRLQALYAQGGMVAPEDLARAEQDVLQTAQGIPGQSEESIQDSMISIFKGAASRSNFRHTALLLGTQEFKNLPLESQVKLEDDLEKREARYVATGGYEHFGDKYMHWAANIELAAKDDINPISPAEVARQEAALNADFRKNTGIKRPYFDRGDYARNISAAQSSLNAKQLREDSQAAAIQAAATLRQNKLDDDARLKLTSDRDLQVQALASLGVPAGASKEDYVRNLAVVFNQKLSSGTEDGIKGAFGLLGSNFDSGGRVEEPGIKRIIMSASAHVRPDSVYTPAFDKAFTIWQNLAAASPSAAAGYAGTELNQRYQVYRDSLQMEGGTTQVAKEYAFAAAFHPEEIRTGGGKAAFGKLEDFEGRIGDMAAKIGNEGFFIPSYAGGQRDLDEYNRKRVIESLKGQIDIAISGPTGQEPEEVIKQVIKSSGWEFMGASAVRNQPDQQDLNRYLGEYVPGAPGEKPRFMVASRERTAEIFDEVIKEQAPLRGLSTDGLTVVRLADRRVPDVNASGGFRLNPQYVVTGRKADGFLASFPLDTDQHLAPKFKYLDPDSDPYKKDKALKSRQYLAQDARGSVASMDNAASEYAKNLQKYRDSKK